MANMFVKLATALILVLPSYAVAFDINRIADVPFCKPEKTTFEFSRTVCGKGLEAALSEAGIQRPEIEVAIKEVGRILDLNEENSEDGQPWWKSEGLFIDKLTLRRAGKLSQKVFEVKAASWTLVLFGIDYSTGKPVLGNFVEHASKYDYSELWPLEVEKNLYITIGSSNGGTNVAEHQLAFYKLDHGKLSLDLAIPTKGERRGWNSNCDFSYETLELCPKTLGETQGLGMRMLINYLAPSCATGKDSGDDDGEPAFLLKDEVEFFFDLNEKGGLSFDKLKSTSRFAPEDQIYHCSDPHEFITTHFEKFEGIAKGSDKVAKNWLKCLIDAAKAEGPAKAKIKSLKAMLAK